MRKLIVLLLLVFLLVGCEVKYPNENNTLKDGMPLDLTSFEVKGEWLTGDDIFDISKDDVDKLFKRSSEFGVTDVYLLVKGTKGKLSCMNSNVALGKSDYDGRDILQEAITSAHKYGIRLNAWISVCNDELYQQTFNESGNYHYIRGYDNSWINPKNEGYRTYLKSLLEELITNYDIDGVSFDYLRYNHVCNGWSNEDIQGMIDSSSDTVTEKELKELLNKTFYDEEKDSEYLFNEYLNGNSAAKAIAKYRQDNIINLENYLVNIIKNANDELLISRTLSIEDTINYFGELHYGITYNGEYSLCDYVLPMLYTNEYGLTSSWIESSIKSLASSGYKSIVPIIQSYYPATSKDMILDTEAVRNLLNDPKYQKNIKGISYFRINTYSYADVTYYDSFKALKVDVYNTLKELEYDYIIIELQEGLRADLAFIEKGFKENASIIITDNGTKVILSCLTLNEDLSNLQFESSPVLSALSNGSFNIVIDGEVSMDKPLAVVRVFAGNESRALHSYTYVPVIE